MNDKSKQFQRVAIASEISEGDKRVYSISGKRILICHTEGSFYAIDDRCTHDNGPLGEGEMFDTQVECPRHGARFDLKTGKALCLPAVGAVSTYDIEIRDGEIWIGL
jgi:3-phenylpropionate/trans-cinnamate dioxygenase ferredoxin subunit